MTSIRLRSYIILLIIFIIFLLGISMSILWGAYKLSPLNDKISNEHLKLLETQFNLNDRDKVLPLFELVRVGQGNFFESIKTLNLDIFQSDIGKIKFIVENPVRNTLFSTGNINTYEIDNEIFIGIHTMKIAAEIFSILNDFLKIYEPSKFKCENDAFYLRIPYLVFNDDIDVFDIGCAFNGRSSLRVFKDKKNSKKFLISRSIPIKNNDHTVVGVLSVISDAKIFEKKLGYALIVILAPVIISILLVIIFIYYFQYILRGQANKNWVNAKNIAHVLKNKTSAIKFYSEKEINNIKTAKTIIKKINLVNENLNKIIYETLDKARSEHKGEKDNSSELQNKNCSLVEIFKKINEIYFSNNISVLNIQDLKLAGEENDIFEALSAVVDNAIFWHKGKEKILINLIKSEKNFIFISIADRGPGISEKDKKKVFKQSFSNSGSTGIGLFKANGLIKEIGGSIKISDREGGGTEFIFKLKVYDHQI